MYTQRVARAEELLTTTREDGGALHTAADGAVPQLMGVVASPAAPAAGGLLRGVVLRQAQLSGARRVVAVTRCREWRGPASGVAYEEHVRRGRDHGLRFHTGVSGGRSAPPWLGLGSGSGLGLAGANPNPNLS